jgi:hypothetical protein
MFSRVTTPLGFQALLTCGSGQTARAYGLWFQAAIAIAFCPWQCRMLATGGGSNDRCIHFYHTISGACLATIDCAAQVTSLVWSTTHREIAATFGFAKPEHHFRIAVFSWPACEQIVVIRGITNTALCTLFRIPMDRKPGMERVRMACGGVEQARRDALLLRRAILRSGSTRYGAKRDGLLRLDLAC